MLARLNLVTCLGKLLFSLLINIADLKNYYLLFYIDIENNNES